MVCNIVKMVLFKVIKDFNKHVCLNKEKHF